MGLDKFGASDLQQNQTAMTMLKGGQTGEAFSDIAKTLPNITALVPEEALDDEEMQQDDKEEATEGGGQQRGEKRKSPEVENSPGTDAKKSKKYWYKDGYIAVLPKPGLGIVVDEAAVRKAAAAGHSWKDREWELPDGTPTTW